MAVLTVEVVSAHGTVWSGHARQVVAPAVDGELGVLVGHTPVLAVLGAGRVRVSTSDGDHLAWGVTGGFLSVDSDRVTVVVDDVDADRAAGPVTTAH